MSKLPSHYSKFLKDYPEVGAAYKALGEASITAGPLDRKCVELIKLGVSTGARMESAVKSHARKAIEAGAAPDEIRHAVLAAITTIGFPTMMAALSWVEDVLAPRG